MQNRTPGVFSVRTLGQGGVGSSVFTLAKYFTGWNPPAEVQLAIVILLISAVSFIQNLVEKRANDKADS